MASPPMPPLLDQLVMRRFSFYPAILNIEHNEWLFRKATWPEIVVVNSKTGEELSIPRRFIGEVSVIDDPVLIVGLVRELEYRDGAVAPYQRQVIPMPVAVGEERAAPAPSYGTAAAPVVAIRAEPRRARRLIQFVVGLLAVALLSALLRGLKLF